MLLFAADADANETQQYKGPATACDITIAVA